MKEKKSVSMKVAIILVIAVLLIGCTVGGTLAWLIATTTPVQNTFVAGDIGDLDLDETTGDKYIIIPGTEITKNPVVTFSGNNIKAYVFLKVDAPAWTVITTDTTHTYTMGSNEMSWVLKGWTVLEPGVYYKAVDPNANETWHLIDGDKITVSSSITKDTIESFESSVSFTAYAIQQEGFPSVEAAWTAAQNP